MRFGHIPLLIVLQALFIILFAVFVDYDPVTAVSHKGGPKYDTKWLEGEPEKGKLLKDETLGTSNEEGSTLLNGYPSEHYKTIFANNNMLKITNLKRSAFVIIIRGNKSFHSFSR